MAKEFKQFDRIVTREEINECRKKWLYERVKDIDLLKNYNCWIEPVDRWSNIQIRNSVYLCADHYKWQVFRVAMKGLTTHEKIFMLRMWFNEYCKGSLEQYSRNKCRVDNYLGALVRGGQLNTNYEVVR